MELTCEKIEELGEDLYGALKLRMCQCKRRFPYSGEGVLMCGRCRAMIAWEKRKGGLSETERNFNAKFI